MQIPLTLTSPIAMVHYILYNGLIHVLTCCIAVSERSVCLLLAQEVAVAEHTEYEDNDQGLHPSVMIVNGLALEEDQYVLESPILMKQAYILYVQTEISIRYSSTRPSSNHWSVVETPGALKSPATPNCYVDRYPGSFHARGYKGEVQGCTKGRA